MIISSDADKAFDEIHHPFMIKTLGRQLIGGHFFNLIKDIYKKSIVNILNGEIVNIFPKIRIRQGYPLSPLIFNSMPSQC